MPDINRVAAAVERFKAEMQMLGVNVTGFEIAGDSDRRAILAMLGNVLTIRELGGEMALAGVRITTRGGKPHA